MVKSKKNKDNKIQSTLSFTNDGKLALSISSTGKLNNKSVEKPIPLPETYKPPKDLGQYDAPLPLIDKSFNVRIKLTYLDNLILELNKKARTNKSLLEKINIHYEIFETDDARLLISLFQRDIPAEERYYKRLATEFRLIKKKKFTKVFLQVMDILKISDLLGIPHIIRGSAGSSLICYLLKITDIDPIKENISLARFMHTQRNDLPDIDMDFPSDRRDEIYAEIFKRYGNKVARISNHVKYSEKTALKKAIRETGYNKFIPKDYEIGDIVSDVSRIDEIYKRAEELDGEFKNYSLHCGGIIIFDIPIP
jgi:DNA polymerase III alpha subunit